MIEQGWSGRVDGTDPPPLRCFFERCHRGLMSSPRKTRSSSKVPSAAASSGGGRSDEAAGVRPVVPLVRLIATATGLRDSRQTILDGFRARLSMLTSNLEQGELSPEAAAQASRELLEGGATLSTLVDNVTQAEEHLAALVSLRKPKASSSSRPPSRSSSPLAVAGAPSAALQQPSAPSRPPPPTWYMFTSPAGPASDTSRTRLCGPVTQLVPSHDPTDPPRLFPLLQPTQEALSSAVVKSKGRRLVLESVSVMLLSGKGVPEQPVSGGSAHERTVSSEMAKLNNAYKSRSVTAKARKTLRYLHLPVVFCSDGCEVDMAYYIEVEGVRRVLAVHELKAPRVAPASALQQVAKYACAAAAGLCQGGVAFEQIVVPMMVSTGLLELHGAAYMASPSLPVAITTSSTLDVNTKQGAAAAHLYRRKAKEQMDRLEVAVRDAAKSPRFTVIENALFPANGEAGAVPSFHPSFSSTAVWPKWSAVSDVAPGGVDAQVFHMHRAFQALYASTAARFVCFPFCYAAGIKCAPTGSDAGRSALLFPNLLSSGYQSALPNEIAVACMYVKAVKEAVAAVREAGVVHGDLYISNIMWRVAAGGDAVEVKLIDWDTVFFSFDGVPRHWEDEWKTRPKWRLYKHWLSQGRRKVGAVAACALDQFMVGTLEHFCSSDKQRWGSWMAATDQALSARSLNRVFLGMQELFATHCHLPELVNTDTSTETPLRHPAPSLAAPTVTVSGGGATLSADSSSPTQRVGKKRRRESDEEEG